MYGFRPLSRQKIAEFAAKNDPPKICGKKYGAPNSPPNFVRRKSTMKINRRRKMFAYLSQVFSFCESRFT